MDFRFTPEQEAFQKEVRAFFKELVAPEKTKGQEDFTELYGLKQPFERALRKAAGDAGYLGVAWPKEYGGQGKDMLYQAIVAYEAAYVGAPVMDISVAMVAAPLMLFGTPEQKAFFLPKILRGELNICLGYSEPNAGSDLANLETKAVADGDDYVINGRKIFTTGAHKADYSWFAARTDPDAPKHKGISIFLIDMKTPGIKVEPVETMAGWIHYRLFLNDVRIPKTSLVGELHRGWYQVATALDFERSNFSAYGQAQRLFDELIHYCRIHWRNGRPLNKIPEVRQKLAQISIDLSTGMRFTKRVAAMQAAGKVPNYEASMNKIWGSELLQRIALTGTQIMGLYGGLERGSPHAPEKGHFSYEYLHGIVGTIGAGSNEIQRNVIAQRGLGMPR